MSRVSLRSSNVGMVLAFLAIPTIASAHGGNNDPNVVHACIANVSKIVRIVGASGSCVSSPSLVAETPAHWAIQGQQGAPGTNGTNGTDGNNGTNGTNGINGTSVTFVDYFTGSTYQGSPTGCPNGGVVYAAGNPAVNAYVCNGTNGTGGTRADGPCFDNINRYVDCGNGTVTDTVTGLIWLQNAACLGTADWAAANGAAAALASGQCGLTDGSSAGDWRLPTKDEWSATIAQAVALGCTFFVAGGAPPSLTNAAGTGCLLSGGGTSFAGVVSVSYWSSTSYEGIPEAGWFANLGTGIVNRGIKVLSLQVWPVRGGPR